jgi:hypothetical protein
MIQKVDTDKYEGKINIPFTDVRDFIFSISQKTARPGKNGWVLTFDIARVSNICFLLEISLFNESKVNTDKYEGKTCTIRRSQRSIF